MSIDTHIEQAEDSIREGLERAQQAAACMDDALTKLVDLAEQGFEPEQLKAAADCLRVSRDNQAAALLRTDLARQYLGVSRRLTVRETR